MPSLSASRKPMIALVLAATLSGCAHVGPAGDEENVDPWEPFNRSMFKFNDNVDRVVLKPVAKGYKAVLPARVRKHVGNFFRNLDEPTTIVNDILQGKFHQSAHDSVRFLFNTTFGILGLFDVSTAFGIERHDEDFGQTFSVWGFGQGPYLVLPLLGPSTLTDSIGLIPSTLYTDPRTANGDAELTYVLLGTDAVDTRARLLGASKVVELQLDPYVFTRETYLQKREQLVYDGEPPQDDDWK